MLTIYQLMKYLRKHHSVGYRFIRQPRQRISFTSLDEVIALNSFDMQLKTLFYPKVMFIENALKSYVIESVLLDSKSENLDVIFNRSITNYRLYPRGSDTYHKQYEKRMNLKGKINNALFWHIFFMCKL